MKRTFSLVILSFFLAVGMAAALQVATQGKVTVEAGLNLRDGPGTNYAIVTTMPKGATVEIVDQVMGWYKVNYQSYHGKYCYSQFIEIIASKELPKEESAKNMMPTLNSTDPQRTPTNKIDPSTLP